MSTTTVAGRVLAPGAAQVARWRDIGAAVARLESARYVFARTMPRIPHWYTLRKWWANPGDYEAAGRVILEHGEALYWNRWKRRYLQANGVKYWVMTEDIAESEVLNRTRSQYEVAYDQIAPAYDSIRAAVPDAGRENEVVREVLGRSLDGSVLDLGCGAGWLLDHYDVPPENYVGVDPSESMLRILASKHPAHVGSVIPCAAKHYWPPDDRRFDVVAGLFGSASLFESDDILRLTSRLRPGGRWVFMFYSAGFAADFWRRWGFTEPVAATGRRVVAGAANPVATIGQFEVFSGVRGSPPVVE